ncbi:Aste57867_17948 [Aphanomyces stellatus]|uniref:Aste57867_17948 protein n=1 Tax=Aphanomyces stellatus TaxID=120398 RepID=A0A485L8S7_9STRA|nr:hypothetical protein As57867_017886 [Aphanomyces stellatus]VFT94689.1 Aste57867_17948 [Aphanomyces stellatus]
MAVCGSCRRGRICHVVVSHVECLGISLGCHCRKKAVDGLGFKVGDMTKLDQGFHNCVVALCAIHEIIHGPILFDASVALLQAAVADDATALERNSCVSSPSAPCCLRRIRLAEVEECKVRLGIEDEADEDQLVFWQVTIPGHGGGCHRRRKKDTDAAALPQECSIVCVEQSYHM